MEFQRSTIRIDDSPTTRSGTRRGRSVGEERGRLALKLGLLGLLTGGLTAVPGLAIGLGGLREGPRRWAVIGTTVSVLVLSAWIGGLAGTLEYMRDRAAAARTNHLIGACQILSSVMMASLVSEVDPADPVPPDRDRIARALATASPRLREYGDPPAPLSVEPLEAPLGALVRWRVGPSADPAAGSILGEVDVGRSGVFLFAADGRTIWNFRRAFDSRFANYDDAESALIAATRPAAEAIVAATRDAGGGLPDAVEAARILAAAGLESPPIYRPRPGGTFDLVIPGTRRFATYAGFGGLLVPVLPNAR